MVEWGDRYYLRDNQVLRKGRSLSRVIGTASLGRVGLFYSWIQQSRSWHGLVKSEPAQNRYRELLLIKIHSLPLLSLPHSGPLPEPEPLPAGLPEAIWSWCLSLQPLGRGHCPSLLSLSPWGTGQLWYMLLGGEGACHHILPFTHCRYHALLLTLQVLCCVEGVAQG